MTGIDDPALDAMVPEHVLTRFREEAELAREGYAPFDADAYRQGHLTPVVFGSALRDFSVDQLLRIVARFAPPPRSQPSDKGSGRSAHGRSVGLRLQGPGQHGPEPPRPCRLRSLLLRPLQRGMKLNHVRSGKPLAVNNPIYFFAQERDLAEEAFAGDVIGIPNHGDAARR